MDAQLEINTTAWEQISCDKCNHVTHFEPEFPKDKMRCLHCAPLTPPEKWGTNEEKAS